jgi:hypothetical protein
METAGTGQGNLYRIKIKEEILLVAIILILFIFGAKNLMRQKPVEGT